MGAILGINLAVTAPRRRRAGSHLLPGVPQDFLEIGQVLILGSVLLDRFFLHRFRVLLYYSSSCTNVRLANRDTFRSCIALGGTCRDRALLDWFLLDHLFLNPLLFPILGSYWDCRCGV
jgi:hypothetical protein